MMSTEMNVPGARLTRAQLRKYLGVSAKLEEALKKFHGRESVKELQARTEQIKDIIGALGLDAKGASKKRAFMIFGLHSVAP